MNRLWLSTFALLLCLIQQFGGSNSSLAADRAAENVLPKDTLAFISIPNVPEFAKRFDKTSLGQLLHDSQLQPFLDDLKKLKDEKSKDVEQELGVSIDDLLQLPQGALTLAVVEQPAQKMAVVAMVDYGSHKDAVDKLLQKLHDELEKKDADHSTDDINNIKLHVYKIKDENAGDSRNTITYFTDDSNLVLSTEVEAIKVVIDRWSGSSDDTLAQNDQFKYIQSQCKFENAEPLLKLFVNPIGTINAVVALAQASVPQAGMALGIMPLLGLDGLKGYGGAISFDDGDFESVANFFLYVENPRGLLGMFNFPAAQLAPPKWVPASIGSYAVMNWNIVGAYSSVESLYDQFQGRGAMARVVEQLSAAGPNIHLKKDIIDNLDGKIQFLQSESEKTDNDSPTVPEVLFTFGLKDAAKMKKVLTAVARAGGSNVDTRDFNGETIYEVSAPNSDQALSFAVTEGMLVVTNDTPMMESIIRGRATRSEALVDSDEYKKIAKHFPSKTSMLGFQRGDAQFKMLYEMMKQAEDSVEGLDFSKLPSFDSISKYFIPSGSYVIPDAKGAKTVTFSPKR